MAISRYYISTMNEKAHFSTKARVVDLLGREQIADAPTAITELLKNAIDAAAKKADVRYNTKTRCLEIEDDGLGMRLDDVKTKWMVLATDSKHGKETGEDEEWAKYATDEQREKLKNKPLGEKGIGRLAVAALGNGTLVWTRWGEGKDTQRSLLLVHWHFFRHPAFLLDEIDFPIAEVKEGDDPKEVALRLCNEFAQWFEGKVGKWETIDQAVLAAEIEDDLTNVFPKAIQEVKFDREMGTLFGVLGVTEEVSEIFIDEIQKGDDVVASEGLRTFYAFSDPFGVLESKLIVSPFIDGEAAYKRSKKNREFWKPTDFKICDHRLDLTVEPNGFVSGEIRRFKEKLQYQLMPSTAINQSALPGPFTIKIGYLPGNTDDSELSQDEHEIFKSRLDAYGGLYIYRDGVRVMPYGRVDADFLRFEERRSKNAGRYYFSYRRMFGAIYLSSKENTKLEDKAGREGFIQNSYYRNFRDIAIDIFIDIAKNYFGSDSEYKKEEKKEKEKTKKHKDRVKEATNKFKKEFKETRSFLTEKEKNYRKQISTLDEKITKLERQPGFILEEIDDVVGELKSIINNFDALLDELISELPNLVILTTSQNRIWDNYLNKRETFELKTRKQLVELSQRLDKITAAYKKEKERIEEIENRIHANEKFIQNKINEKSDEFLAISQKLSSDYVPNWQKKQLTKLNNIYQSRMNNQSAYDIVKDEKGVLLKLLEETISLQRKELREEVLPFWNNVIYQIQNLENSLSSEFAIKEIHREMEALQEKDVILSNLAQVGLVLETISHDYNAMFDDVDSTLLQLQKKEKELPKKTISQLSHLRDLFRSIHSRLELLEPLYLRTPPNIVDITGNELKEFIQKRFEPEKLPNIKLDFTNRFEKVRLVKVNRSVLLAALFNMIINAIYWVGKTSDPPIIQFDFFPNGFSISDSGPGINPRDQQRIFDPFFSRKPDGRGLGLYIAKTTLKATGYELIVAEEPLEKGLPGANFIIVKLDQNSNNDNDEL